ncbi:MAG: DUF89 family protein [Ruminococcaceae bacterium]|nr:DUF89 family protein [Oscillospiraceae bacterium]
MVCNSNCVMCIAKRQARLAEKLPDDAQRTAYLCEALRVIAENAPHFPAPVIIGKLAEVQKGFFGDIDHYEEIKHRYNGFMMERAEAISRRISDSADPLRTAVLYSRAGNYIDFGAMHEVDDEMLQRILDTADTEPLDEAVYKRFTEELSAAKTLVLLTDNCGEIVLDKLLLQTIGRLYPHISLTVMVKERPALNDATAVDAAEVGMEDAARVTGNGIEGGTPGTWLDFLPEEKRQLLEDADIVIAKGQANLETLIGCGLRVWYLLMCKCQRFVEMTGQEQYSGMMLREGSIRFNG